MKSFFTLRAMLLAAGLTGLLLSSACTYEVGPPCAIENPEAVRFSTDVLPILQANCMNCHSKENALLLGGGNNWEDFAAFHHEVEDGTLVKVLEQTDNNYKTLYMPRSAPKLSACQIERIKVWIKNGAKHD